MNIIVDIQQQEINFTHCGEAQRERKAMKLYAVTSCKNDNLSKNFDCLYIDHKANLLHGIDVYLENEDFGGEFYFYEFEVDEKMCATVFTCFLHGDSDNSWSKNVKFTLYREIRNHKQ